VVKIINPENPVNPWPRPDIEDTESNDVLSIEIVLTLLQTMSRQGRPVE